MFCFFKCLMKCIKESMKKSESGILKVAEAYKAESAEPKRIKRVYKKRVKKSSQVNSSL